jgi:eukaryotic-like serine/threonine-protein kinase
MKPQASTDAARGMFVRSHSLWYCDARESGRYQWFETAFMISPLIPRQSSLNPFGLDPGEDAAKALGPGMAELQLAWPFTVVGIGDLDDFIGRWAGWFAEAAQGQLNQPSTMPERQPQGSWRQN